MSRKQQEKKPEPRLKYVVVRMTEKLETDVELLFDTIVEEMGVKKVKGEEKQEFIREYFNTRDQGRDKLMELFHSWVSLWKRPVRV